LSDYCGFHFHDLHLVNSQRRGAENAEEKQERGTDILEMFPGSGEMLAAKIGSPVHQQTTSASNIQYVFSSGLAFLCVLCASALIVLDMP
jgi:hypothetical protein